MMKKNIRRILCDSMVATLVWVTFGIGNSFSAQTQEGAREYGNMLTMPVSKPYLDVMLAHIAKGISAAPGKQKPAAKVEVLEGGDAFEKLCMGQGNPVVDGLMASRRITAVEFERCHERVSGGVVEIKLGYNALAVVVKNESPLTGLSRKMLWRALAAKVPMQGQSSWVANELRTWKQVDATLPDVAIDIALPADRALLQNVVMERACQEVPGQGMQQCESMRAYDNINLSGKDAHIQILPYDQWLLSDQKGKRLLSIEGITPNTATLKAAVYPLGITHYLYLRVNSIQYVSEVYALHYYVLQPSAVLPSSEWIHMGLMPLADEERATVVRKARELRRMSSP